MISKKKPVTMADIARLANVSKPTVSRALSNSPLVNKETRDHVLAISAAHGYNVNRNAQRLRQERTNTIAVSMDFHSHRQNHISDPFIYDLLAGVSEALGDHNQDLLLCAPAHNDANAFLRILSARGADGFIILGQGHREDMLKEFAATGAPMVVWGAAENNASYCVVGSDNYLGGQLAGRHFLAHDRRHYLFVGDNSFREIRQRRDGLKSIVDSVSADVSMDEIELHSLSYDSAYAAAERYLQMTDTIPDAVFAFSDTCAMAMILAFRDAGIDVPRDVSVVGYNDIPAAQYFSPPITTIRQDTHKAGRQLVAKLLRILEGGRPKSSVIKTELILRGT